MTTPDIAGILADGPVIPVIVIEDVAQAVPLAKALVAGGVRVLEVTLRTDAGLESIRRMIAEAGADPMQAALAFALGRPEASAVIVGVASPAELRAIVRAAAAVPPVLDWQALALDHAIALDPQLWAAA